MAALVVAICVHSPALARLIASRPDRLTDSSLPFLCLPRKLQTFAPKLVILDFSDMESMEEVVTEVVECYGCVDVLVCNSSMKLKAPVQSVSLELDRNIMDINYFGPSTLAKGRDKLCLGRSLVGDGIADAGDVLCDRYPPHYDLQKIRTHSTGQQHPGQTGCPFQKLL